MKLTRHGESQLDAAIRMRISDFNSSQRKAITILGLLNFVNYVDRQVIFALFPFIRQDFHLSYGQLGYLATAFTVVLSLSTFPLGMLADRFSRRWVISGGVLFWSAATFLSGLAGSFRSLLTARAMVGIGEAAYAPAGTAVLSGVFPKEVRARIQGICDIGMFAGGATGIALGGIMAASFGWRMAFFFVGIPGLLLGLSAMRLPEPARSAGTQTVQLRDLVRVPAYLAVLAAGWFSSFAGYTYIAWGPDLIQEVKGFTARQAALALGCVVVLAGALGIATGAYFSDRLAKLWPWGRPLIIPVGFLLSAPAIFAALHTSAKISFLLLFGLGTFFMSWYHGPLTATIHDLVPPSGHATALGLYYLFVNLFAMAFAPLVVGRAADRYGLINALHIPVAAQLIGGACFVLVVFLIRHHGLHHRVLNRYWEPQPLMPSLVTAELETTSI
ncbi:MAG TPA: MFS transporter [Terriglobales bacterium]